MKEFRIKRFFMPIGILLLSFCFSVPSSASALTVAEVVKDLACPCECPLILEDCNMSCGLEWKEEVGQLILKGMSKEQIMEYFINEYGDEARLTPIQKIEGKIYQYTRSFETIDWVLLWTGVIGWLALMFAGIYFVIKKFLFNKPAA